jgi:tRNA(fMet)-specific endonuclease VapC
MYFLDTNICIYYLTGRSPAIRDRILSTPPIEIEIPAVVKAELILGAYKSTHREDTLEKIEQFLDPFRIVSFEDQMTYTYAEIRSSTEQRGESVGPNDLLIASIVKYNDGTLVTNNQREFGRIDGLKTENWMQKRQVQ